MAIADTIQSIKTHTQNAYAKIGEKGGTVPTNKNLENLSSSIESIPAGGGTDMLQSRVDETKSCSYLFYQYTGTNPNIVKNLNTTGVTSMKNMFAGCILLTSLDVSNLDTSEVTSMSYMFQNCNKFTNLDLSNFDTSKVTIMDFMFSSCTNLTSVNLSSFNTSNVTNMQAMFSYCRNLTSLDLSNFNTSKVTSMQQMFQTCQQLTSLDLSNFNTSKVTNMYSIFGSCNKLTSIIGVLDLISCTSTGDMFYHCDKLTTVTLKNIKANLQIGSGTSWGNLLTDDTIINTAKELWDFTGTSSKTLTVSTPTSARLNEIYVKLIDATDEMIATDPNITNKKPCEVCESTDDGAMTLREYIVSKNWAISG